MKTLNLTEKIVPLVNMYPILMKPSIRWAHSSNLEFGCTLKWEKLQVLPPNRIDSRSLAPPHIVSRVRME